MATKRGKRYWMDRAYPGVGRTHRSLKTTSKARAEKREQMLDALAHRGQLHFLRAFNNGKVDIAQLEEAFETGRLPELAADLSRNDQPLADASREFLAAQTHLAGSSRSRYSHTLRHLEEFAGEKATVQGTLKPEAVSKFTNFLLEKGLAKATVNRHLAGLSRFSTFCAERGWHEQPLKVKKLRIPKGRMRWLEVGDVALYLANVEPALRPLFILLIGSGIDLGEATGTRDNPERALRVCDLRLGDGEAWVLIADGKAPERARRAFLWPWVVEALNQHIERNGLGGSDRLFTWPRRTIQKAHERACKAAGIMDYRIKDHRHTAAVAMTRAGMPLDLIQKQLGHSDIRQTMVYAQFNPEYGDYARYTEQVETRLAGDRTKSHTTFSTTVGSDR